MAADLLARELQPTSRRLAITVTAFSAHPFPYPRPVTMKLAIVATLVAAASAFSVQKDFAKVRVRIGLKRRGWPTDVAACLVCSRTAIDVPRFWARG
jgi:hypothetical protein